MAAQDEVSSSRSALSKAFRGLTSEVAADKKQRATELADLVERLRKGEQAIAAKFFAECNDECSVQGRAVEQLAEVVTANGERSVREQRGLWTKVHELSRGFRERLPAERREALEVAERQLGQTRERLRQDLQQDLLNWFGGEVRHVRDSVCTQLGTELEGQVVAIAERYLADLGSELRCELMERCDMAAVNASTSCKETAQAVSDRCEALAQGCGAESEAECVALRRIVADNCHTTEEVRAELFAFMDEQRVFCGFLDTEQKSYHDLIRQELQTLSQLVDSTLQTELPANAPPLPTCSSPSKVTLR